MKKLISLCFVTFCILGCESKKEEYQAELKKLQNQIFNAKKEYAYLVEETDKVKMQETVRLYMSTVQDLQIRENQLREKISNFEQQLISKKAQLEGRESYLLTLELKQSHFALDFSAAIKDDMNAVKFQIPVSKEYFDILTEGQLILDKFREGSFWVDGSCGNWNVTVIKKEVKIEPLEKMQ